MIVNKGDNIKTERTTTSHLKQLHIKNTRYEDENQSPGFGQAEKYSEEYQSNVHNISILNGF